MRSSMLSSDQYPTLWLVNCEMLYAGSGEEAVLKTRGLRSAPRADDRERRSYEAAGRDVDAHQTLPARRAILNSRLTMWRSFFGKAEAP
jgi:hypothetical protein